MVIQLFFTGEMVGTHCEQNAITVVRSMISKWECELKKKIKK